MRFETEEEALQIANGTSYGLASYIWTNDVGRINRLVPRLEAGGVYVNGASPVTGCELPFGGVGISGLRPGGRPRRPARVRADQGGGDRMTVPLDLDGAAAVLTGAGSGIGRATAISLAARGCTDRGQRPRRRPGRGDRRASSATAGGEAVGLEVDVSKQDGPRGAPRPAASTGSVGSTSS